MHRVFQALQEDQEDQEDQEGRVDRVDQDNRAIQENRAIQAIQGNQEMMVFHIRPQFLSTPWMAVPMAVLTGQAVRNKRNI